MKYLEPIGWICLIAFCLHQLKVADMQQFIQDNWQRISVESVEQPAQEVRVEK